MKKAFREKLEQNVKVNQAFAALLNETIDSQETEAVHKASLDGVDYYSLSPEEKKLLLCQ